MKLEFVAPSHAFPAGHLEINDARIIWPNFSGKPTEFNPEGGKREFNLVIPDDEIADALRNDKSKYGDSWNVKTTRPRNEDDTPITYLPVKVKFNSRGPSIYLDTGKKRVRLTEETVSCLDVIDIIKVDLDVRPYDSEKGRNTYRTAYLAGMCVYQRPDRFADRFGGSDEGDFYDEDGDTDF
jgi:hypothetical protein